MIVLHVGTAEGWVNGAELVFRAKSSTGDLDSYFMHLLNLDSFSFLINFIPYMCIGFHNNNLCLPLLWQLSPSLAIHVPSNGTGGTILGGGWVANAAVPPP